MRLPGWCDGKRIHQPTQEIQVLSLGWEDLLEKEMATHSSILARRIPWTEDSGGLQSMGSQKRQTRLSTHMCLLEVGGTCSPQAPTPTKQFEFVPCGQRLQNINSRAIERGDWAITHQPLPR